MGALAVELGELLSWCRDLIGRIQIVEEEAGISKIGKTEMKERMERLELQNRDLRLEKESPENMLGESYVTSLEHRRKKSC